MSQRISNCFANQIDIHLFNSLFNLLRPLISVNTVDSWFLMKSPLPIVFIFTFYLMTVFIIGPKFMKNRDPFDLKRVILVYNIFQIAASTAIVAGVKFSISLLEHIKNVFYFSFIAMVLAFETPGSVWRI